MKQRGTESGIESCGGGESDRGSRAGLGGSKIVDVLFHHGLQRSNDLLGNGRM